MSPGTSWTFTLNSLCSLPGIHYPAKDAGVRLCPLQRQTGAHPPWPPNKPPLSFPLLQSKVAFKGRTVSGFVFQTAKAPGARPGTEQLVPQDGSPLTVRKVERDSRQSPRPSQTTEKEGEQLCGSGSHSPETAEELSDSAGHTTWPLSFSTFSMAPASLPMACK